MKMLCSKTKKQTMKLRVSTSGVENIQDVVNLPMNGHAMQIQPKQTNKHEKIWFAKFCTNEPQDFWNVLCLYAQSHAKHSISAQSRHVISTVKHGGGGVIICFGFFCLFLQPQDLSTLCSLNSSVYRQ